MQNYENESKDPNNQKNKNNPGKSRKPGPDLSWREYDDFKSKTRPILTADYYTVAQAARLLGNSPKSVSRYIEVGKLPHCLNISVTGTRRHMRIPRASIEYFLDSQSE